MEDPAAIQPVTEQTPPPAPVAPDPTEPAEDSASPDENPPAAEGQAPALIAETADAETAAEPEDSDSPPPPAPVAPKPAGPIQPIGVETKPIHQPEPERVPSLTPLVADLPVLDPNKKCPHCGRYGTRHRIDCVYTLAAKGR